MSYNYLDKTGLASVWAKIKAALATKANSADLADIATSGSYEDLNDIPEILTTNDDVVTEDQVPYLFRKSPDSDRAVEEIVGGTVGWNQLAVLPVTRTQSGITVTNNGDGSLTIDGTATEFTNSFSINSTWTSGHVYYFGGVPNDIKLYIQLYQDSTWVKNLNLSEKPRIRKLTDSATANRIMASQYILSNTTFDNVRYWPQIFDITTMLGTTIADYIYSLETATAGAGVAKLKEWGFFTEDYYEYCEPTLRSVEGLVSKKTVGFNQWDEELESGYYDAITGEKQSRGNWKRNKNLIRVVSNTDYYFKITVPDSGSFGAVLFYDASENVISYITNSANIANRTFTTPVNCCYMAFYAHPNWFANPICINLSDPTRNGQYEPYESHSYSLDSEVVLRGVPKLDSNNNLYYDGDVYPADEQGKRRYGLVDLGELIFSDNGATSSAQQFVTFGIPKANGETNFICQDFIVTMTGHVGTVAGRASTKAVVFCVAPGTSLADFSASVAGKKLVYELATPTTFTATPYHNPQIVGDTEEWVTTGIVPVGHNTKYHTSYYTTNDYIKEKGYLTEKDILGKVNTSDLATVATSGSYSDLDDTPTKVSDFENDAAYMSGMTILAYGKSNWTDFITAYTEQKVVYCRASSNSNPASGSQTRLAFMAYVNNADNPTEVEFQYYRSVSSHSNNQQGDQVYVYKLTKSGGWTVTVRESYTKVVAGTGLSGNWASGAITLSLNNSATATTSANGLMSSTDKSRLDTLYADYSSALTALGVN